jgi:hypothetical protein
MQKTIKVHFSQLQEEIDKQINNGFIYRDHIDIDQTNQFIVIFDSVAGIRHNKISSILDVDIQDIIDKYHTPDNYDSFHKKYRFSEDDVKKIIKEIQHDLS